METYETPSLLWPNGVQRNLNTGFRWGDNSYLDLKVSELAVATCIDPRYLAKTENIFKGLSLSPEVIRYRQDVLKDFVENPKLADGLEEALEAMQRASELYGREAEESAFFAMMRRLVSLEVYVEIIEKLVSAFRGTQLKSIGLQEVQKFALETNEDPSFVKLAGELPSLREKVNGAKSVTIAINLDSSLMPDQAILLSINNRHYKGNDSLAGKLMASTGNEMVGVGKTHKLQKASMLMISPSSSVQIPESPKNILVSTLLQDLAKILEQTSKPINRSLKDFQYVNGQVLLPLEDEIAFFIGAYRLHTKFSDSKLSVCFPELAPSDSRISKFDNLYNAHLALRMLNGPEASSASSRIVPSDAHFGEEGRIFILTGPNSGGKTTFIQAIALAHTLAQVGLFVPATKAEFSPIDGLFTHYSTEEKPEGETGRLGEESGRLKDIFKRATRQSLVLLNETFSSTSPGEALYLARDVCMAFRSQGSRAIFATHMHELAEVDKINSGIEGDSLVASLISVAGDSSDPSKRTYKIVRSGAEGFSHAKDIARQYGIGLDQLLETIKDHN